LYSSVIKILLRVYEQEQQLIQSERLAELGTLTAGIAHEINNPLNTIITKLEMLDKYVLDFKHFLTSFKDDNRLLLKEYGELNIDFIIERLEKSVKLPLEMAERVKATVMSLKKFAASDKGELETVDIHDILEDALLIAWHKIKHKAEVTKKYDLSLGPVRTSVNRLSQVFVNILDNAADAIKDFGRINIQTAHNANEVVVKITDNGAGISEENLKKVFNSYFTTRDEGLGLGLFISKNIIEELKGNIEVESEQGKFTTFTIRLPIQIEEEHEEAQIAIGG
jgi:signal transduction histidine kinase